MISAAARLRFWSKVARGPENACWPWQGGTTKDGYGRFFANGEIKAHRFAFQLAQGYAAKLDVLHSCNNPPCCNPRHLRDGTHAENMLDVRTSRARRGEKNARATLTAVQVMTIRARWRPYARGANSQARLAAEFGVTQSMISKIVRRENWSVA